MDPIRLDAPRAQTPMGRERTSSPPPAETDRDLQELKATDRRVRAHEAAHVAAGAGLVRGGASFSYRKGSDGQLYAVAGEVSIDSSAVPNNPKATAAKMQQVQRAALAPADPSAQDRSVAAQAAVAESQAQMEVAKEALRKAMPAKGGSHPGLDVTV